MVKVYWLMGPLRGLLVTKLLYDWRFTASQFVLASGPLRVCKSSTRMYDRLHTELTLKGALKKGL
jgi:hypothetical protein